MGGFKLRDGFLGVFDMDFKFLECRSDEEFILYVRHQCLLNLLMRHSDIPFLDFLGVCRKDLGLPLQYLY